MDHWPLIIGIICFFYFLFFLFQGPQNDAKKIISFAAMMF